MIFLWFPIGLILPTLIGFFALRLIEWKSPVLRSCERWIIGFVLGVTLTMYLTFLAHILGIVQFTFWGFLSVQVIVASIFGLFYLRLKNNLCKRHPEPVERATFAGTSWIRGSTELTMTSAHHDVPQSYTTSYLLKILLILLVLWTILKIFIGASFLVATPPYHDDVFNNWNMRGKLFYETERLTLTIPLGDEQLSRTGVSSYPPTVSMFKTWLATLAGEWDEGLVNAIHILWYLSALALVFLFLRRFTSFLWASLGTYLLASLPLYLIHGSNAYADVFLSLHLFTAVTFLFCAGMQKDRESALTFVRLSGFISALLVFTKNEALLLYLPPLLLTTLLLLLWLRRTSAIVGQEYSCPTIAAEVGRPFLWYLLTISTTLIPWIIFKWMHALPFGNAKSLSTFTFGWQPDVLHAIAVNTFLEGNWLLLFSLLFTTLLWCWRKAFFSPLLILTGFFLAVYLGQMPLYLFTTLSIEVLNQTGYARGLIHLMPIACVITTLLLQERLSSTKED